MIVSVDVAHFPLVNALITGQTRLDKNARCYVRYKFYDRSKYNFDPRYRSCLSVSLSVRSYARYQFYDRSKLYGNKYLN